MRAAVFLVAVIGTTLSETHDLRLFSKNCALLLLPFRSLERYEDHELKDTDAAQLVNAWDDHPELAKLVTDVYRTYFESSVALSTRKPQFKSFDCQLLVVRLPLYFKKIFAIVGGRIKSEDRDLLQEGIDIDNNAGRTEELKHRDQVKMRFLKHAQDMLTALGGEEEIKKSAEGVIQNARDKLLTSTLMAMGLFILSILGLYVSQYKQKTS